MSLWLPGAKLYQIKTLLSLTITVKYLSNLSFSYSLHSYLMSLELRFLSYSVTSTTLFSVDNFVVIFFLILVFFFLIYLETPSGKHFAKEILDNLPTVMALHYYEVLNAMILLSKVKVKGMCPR